jgi:hypothetical protein
MTKLRSSFRAPAITLLLAISTAACGSSAGPTATPGGSQIPGSPPAPTATPVVDGIEHPKGPHDVILRMETSGGFVPVEFMATSAPSFTLYGDGTVVFRDSTASPPVSNDNINRSVPFQTIRLGEDAIQSLLANAIGPGGLGIAVGPYTGHVADLPSTEFTIAADGRTKTVSVTGLSPDMHDSQEAGIVTALAGLADRLDHFGSSIGGEEPYVPTAYRGVLSPTDQAIGPVVKWPWTTFGPEAFAKGVNEFLLTHVLTPADVAALGIAGAEGGLQGLTLQQGTKLYSLAIRPLLPDEAN